MVARPGWSLAFQEFSLAMDCGGLVNALLIIWY
jgi:hypothetical protein